MNAELGVTAAHLDSSWSRMPPVAASSSDSATSDAASSWLLVSRTWRNTFAAFNALRTLFNQSADIACTAVQMSKRRRSNCAIPLQLSLRSYLASDGLAVRHAGKGDEGGCRNMRRVRDGRRRRGAAREGVVAAAGHRLLLRRAAGAALAGGAARHVRATACERILPTSKTKSGRASQLVVGGS